MSAGSMTSHIQRECRDQVQTLRFNRPEKKNAITADMYAALAKGLRGGDADPDVAVHLIAGSGGIFTAGNDLAEFLKMAEGGDFDSTVFDFMKALATSEKPIVAAVDGLAVGIGTTMLLHCDLVHASEDAKFLTPFLNLGILPEAASSLLAPARMGFAPAFALLCAGETFDARRALATGLVNSIVPADELETKARDAALVLAAKPVQALAAARKLMRGDPSAVLQRIDEEIELFKVHLRSPEAREAFTAFKEKREPDFARARSEAEAAQ